MPRRRSRSPAREPSGSPATSRSSMRSRRRSGPRRRPPRWQRSWRSACRRSPARRPPSSTTSSPDGRPRPARLRSPPTPHAPATGAALTARRRRTTAGVPDAPVWREEDGGVLARRPARRRGRPHRAARRRVSGPTALPDDATRRLVETIAGHAAQPLERARLHEREHAARVQAELSGRRTRRLQALTAAFAGALTPAEVAATLPRRDVRGRRRRRGGARRPRRRGARAERRALTRLPRGAARAGGRRPADGRRPRGVRGPAPGGVLLRERARRSSPSIPSCAARSPRPIRARTRSSP